MGWQRIRPNISTAREIGASFSKDKCVRTSCFGVIETMADVILERGVPEHIRSDNGAEMTAKIVRNWLAKLGAKTLYIEPGSPWENGYCESFNGNSMES